MKFKNLNPVLREYGSSETTPSYTYSKVFEDHDIWIVRDGEAFISIKGGEKIRLVKGIVLLLKPGDEYDFSGIADTSFSLFFAHFDPVEGKKRNRNYFRGLPYFFNIGISRADYFLNQFLLLTEMQKNNASYSWLMGKSVITGLLSFILEITFGHNYFYRNSPQKDLVEKAILFMEQNYASQIQLKELAGLVSLSPVYFGKIFRQITDLSPIQYLIKIRLEKAKMLLLYSNLPLKTIAIETGFTDVHYFTYIFSRNEKISPGEYRRNKDSF